jgi:adenylate cyclase
MKGLIRRAQQVGLARAVCIVLLFALVPLRLADPRPLAELRVRTFDFFQVLRPRQQDIRPVVIVDIDEASLKAIGQWPWPRTTVGDLVTQITQLGAVAVGFDIIFPEPDRMSPAIAERSFRGIDPETRAKLDSLPSNDDALAEAIKRSRVVVGQAGAAEPEPKTAADAALQTGFAVRGPDPSPYLVTFPGLLRNVPPIEKAAAGRGLFSIDPESDGIIRRVPVIMMAQGSLVPSLSMELLHVVTGSSAILVRVNDAGVQAVAVPGLELPTDRNGQFWVHFNKHDPTRYVSAKDVLQGNVPPDRLAGKLVLWHVGDRAPGSENHPGRCGNPGRRGACANCGKRAEQIKPG